LGNCGMITGAFSSDTTISTPVAINKGGTGQTTAQAAIDALTAVSGASTNEVLTKDGSGNAVFAAASGGAQLDEANTWTAAQTFNNLKYKQFTEYTLDTNGDITYASNLIKMDTFEDASTDDWNGVIFAGSVGDDAILYVVPESSSRDITIKDDISSPGDPLRTAGDFTMSNQNDTFVIINNGVIGHLQELSRSDNG